MPYVPGFTNDIFISFSNVDNLDDWVENFQDHLNNRLLQIDAQVTIWRDSKLRGTDVFSDEIFAQLQQSALLISIISPAGIKSRWCEDERQAFERFAALNGGFRFGNHLRAIKVVKTPLPADHHRDLFGVLGFEFYKREKQSDRFYEFDQSSPEFRRKCNELAQDIKSVLDAFRKHSKGEVRKRKTVYVATTTVDLKPRRDIIVRQLQDWGYAVVPQDSEPLRSLASLRAVTNPELEASLFSVHLVSDRPIPILESGEDSIAEQYQIAQELRKDRLIWVEPGRRLYKQFDDALELGLQNGVEIVEDRTIEKFKEVIAEKLNRLRKPALSHKKLAIAELYLICHRHDHPSLEDARGGPRALRVKEYLDENGLVVMPSPFSKMRWNKLKKEYREQLQFSNAVLLYWGEAPEDWFLNTRRIIVEEQIRRNKTSNTETLIKAFYFTSPPLEKSQYQKLAEFVFEQYDDFEPNALKPLLNRLLEIEDA